MWRGHKWIQKSLQICALQTCILYNPPKSCCFSTSPLRFNGRSNIGRSLPGFIIFKPHAKVLMLYKAATWTTKIQLLLIKLVLKSSHFHHPGSREAGWRWGRDSSLVFKSIEFNSANTCDSQLGCPGIWVSLWFLAVPNCYRIDIKYNYHMEVLKRHCFIREIWWWGCAAL